MPVRLRLARHGTRNNPFYHIVAINQRQARNAKPLELLGVYDPIPRVPETRKKTYPEMHATSTKPDHGVATKRIEWSVDRIKHWIKQGAQPSDSVLKLLAMANINVPYRRDWIQKHPPNGVLYHHILRPLKKQLQPSS
ncbi:37S ribosomal protein S16, mitochondrial [Serendipita sp. 401]|nr:37S ribosomal protein S16, mitochondrial [Serendipita sp. 397]KAG8769846.1 37S ribosomal protein S16, mitochondrial [Serendipita sp. 398]KAG8819925.1 37S ribosomal protein S16, mitochondrial [Serendipita sp. 401]KAG8834904.1 37S ribosomal protein S16, mitochondrial [Serendipita sp. 400]KAG8836894.1 37S ribosomal protein S16, mitochondrial [Serendipita sp. 405]KAG9052909.1 37S ribosomal protein S16, mitochondrial [Serendipita sp. 407]